MTELLNNIIKYLYDLIVDLLPKKEIYIPIDEIKLYHPLCYCGYPTAKIMYTKTIFMKLYEKYYNGEYYWVCSLMKDGGIDGHLHRNCNFMQRCFDPVNLVL